MSDFLTKDYWNNRYETEQTGWDLRMVSPPLKAYVDQLTNKDIRILIPGCGSGYEAEYLAQEGFSNITVVDFAPSVVENMKEKMKHLQSVQIVCDDFFKHEGKYDLILEQTFFCAIAPSLRPRYVEKMYELLNPSGILAGLLFNVQFPENPPFGGSKTEYEGLFSEKFDIKILETCYNSISKRAGNELFFKFQKK
ncbi:thiopurine S-methyltransferase [Arcicella aurantiaca]|uniref:Thiopurine S-methyltransferase n=1 Tax=Arcicella aurantiaca TaxID=591202 RepID=A0A316E2P1_9BACT|nr:methyltransferase domain-containing protein [Arcicella aurantiaca]PWK23003.1 thiopurine S-methyltransferase [Arcicella aurantiaca]